MDKILNVRIDTVSQDAVGNRVREWLQGSAAHTIYTPNPEMLVLAHKTPLFKEIVNRSDLNVCDGIGVRLFASKQIPRIPGVDLMQEICRIAAQAQKKVYLLGGGEGVALQAARQLKKDFPELRVAGYGNPADMHIVQHPQGWSAADEARHQRVLAHIRSEAPDIVFVAFGQGKQEWWIDTHKHAFPSVRILMGVGGSFDMIAGVVARAPKLFRVLGLEWLWRVCIEPHRWKRILTAIVVFPYYVLSQKFTQKKS